MCGALGVYFGRMRTALIQIGVGILTSLVIAVAIEVVCHARGVPGVACSERIFYAGLVTTLLSVLGGSGPWPRLGLNPGAGPARRGWIDRVVSPSNLMLTTGLSLIGLSVVVLLAR